MGSTAELRTGTTDAGNTMDRLLMPDLASPDLASPIPVYMCSNPPQDLHSIA